VRTAGTSPWTPLAGPVYRALLLTGATLAALTALHRMPPALLLVFNVPARCGPGPHAAGLAGVYQVPTWQEHLRQHEGRLTGAGAAADERVRALATEPPTVTHLLPAQYDN